MHNDKTFIIYIRKSILPVGSDKNRVKILCTGSQKVHGYNVEYNRNK